MRISRFRWAPLCVTATSFTLLSSGALALQTHTLKQGETLAALARQYHVSIQDLTQANHISETTILDLGRTLTIPDPPKHITVPETIHAAATIKSDRVSIRIGPGAEHRRLTMFDLGAPVTVTASQNEWAQVTLPDGKSGWVRRDLLNFGKGHAGQELAANSKPHPKEKHAHHFAPAEAVADNRRRAAKHTARHHTGATEVAHHHKQEQHPKRVARHHHQEREARRTARVEHAKKRHQYARATHHKRYVAEASMPPAGSDVVRTAYAYRGTPYVYGGSSRGGFDCSGFTSYLYRRRGVALPHSASAQFHVGSKVSHKDLKAGDLVFFETVHKGISHVGMYVGNGRFVHASSRRSGGVRVDSLESGYYNERFRGARRVQK